MELSANRRGYIAAKDRSSLHRTSRERRISERREGRSIVVEARRLTLGGINLVDENLSR